ncbi:MAG: aminotransferase class V-fold PLP-dependent enzyme [Planctomycetaceae bacterium]
MLTAESRRRSFPSLAGMAYLNTAAEGIPPLEVKAALDEYFADKQLGMDGRDKHFPKWESLKQLTGEFFGLSAGEIGICSCSSEAYNLAAMAVRLRDGDEVVINDLDFPAGATPWLQADSPATVKIWQAREGRLDIADLAPLLSSRTRLVTVSLVSFFNGYRIHVPDVAEVVRRKSGSLLAVDVTQALGRVPLDLSEADLIVSSTHKWILATHGGGLVGVPARRTREWTVPAGGWFNLENAFGAERFQSAVSKPGADSFSVGMPNFPAVYAVHAGLKYIKSVGVDAIDVAARPLVRQCLAGLKALKVDLLTPPEERHIAGILAFRHPDAERIHKALHAAGVHVMCSAGRMRIAIHGYNTEADIDRLLSALRAAL